MIILFLVFHVTLIKSVLKCVLNTTILTLTIKLLFTLTNNCYTQIFNDLKFL